MILTNDEKTARPHETYNDNGESARVNRNTYSKATGYNYRLTNVIDHYRATPRWKISISY